MSSHRLRHVKSTTKEIAFTLHLRSIYQLTNNINGLIGEWVSLCVSQRNMTTENKLLLKFENVEIKDIRKLSCTADKWYSSSSSGWEIQRYS